EQALQPLSHGSLGIRAAPPSARTAGGRRRGRLLRCGLRLRGRGPRAGGVPRPPVSRGRFELSGGRGGRANESYRRRLFSPGGTPVLSREAPVFWRWSAFTGGCPGTGPRPRGGNCADP